MKISKELFGENYHDISFFKSRYRIKIVAIIKSNVIGFFVAKRTKYKSIQIECIGIKKNYQLKSVGTQLMAYFFNRYTSNKTKVIAYAWKLNEKINAGKLNEKFGLYPTKNIGYIWKDVCNKSFKCPYYNKRCICQSVMYSN